MKTFIQYVACLVITCSSCVTSPLCTINDQSQPVVSTVNNNPFKMPSGLAVNESGNIFVAVQGRHDIIYKMSPDGSSRSEIRAGGNATVDASGIPLNSFNPVSKWERLAIDPTGNLFVADTLIGVIRKITFAFLSSKVSDVVGDTTVNRVEFNDITALAIGGDGAIYVADTVYTADKETYRIHKIINNTVTVIAGTPDHDPPTKTTKPEPVPGEPISLDRPQTIQFKLNRALGIAVDKENNVYFTESDNNRIQKIQTDGTMTTLAGIGTAGFQDGPGATAQFNLPYGITVNHQGMLFVVDSRNRRIRKITPDGVVSTIAGTGDNVTLDGPGATAQFFEPGEITLDKCNIYVAQLDGSIRKITFQ